MSDYKRLTDEELYDFLSRVFVQLQPTLTQQMMSCAKELLEYRSKLENGTLVELPCKVGDRVWLILYEDIYEYEVYGFYIANLGHSGQVNLRTCDFKKNEKMDDERLQCIGIYFDDFSEAVFLTQAEAEAELAKIRGQNDNND